MLGHTIDRIAGAANELSFARIESAVAGDPVLHVAGMDGSLTLAVRGDQLPQRYRHALLAYRFAQYVRLGWVDRDAAATAGTFTDTSTVPGDREFHILVLDRTSGLLVGYLALSQPDTFGIEVDYPLRVGVDLAGGANRERIWEPKRLLRRAHMPASQLARNAPWWALLGMTRIAEQLTENERFDAFVGDGAPNGSPNMLRRLGYRVQTLPTDSYPHNRDGVFGPLWRQGDPACAFHASLTPMNATVIDGLAEFLTSGSKGSVRDYLEARHHLTPTSEEHSIHA